MLCDQGTEQDPGRNWFPGCGSWQALAGWGVTAGRTPLTPAGGGPMLTHGRGCGPSSHTAASPAGRRPGRTPGAQGRRTAAPGHTCTASSHTGPRKARGPPGGGSGRTPRRSSEAGTAPTGPAGGRGHLSEGAAHAAWHPLTLVLGDPPCPETQACSLTPSRCLSTSVKRNSPVSGTLSDPCLMGQPETRATS